MRSGRRLPLAVRARGVPPLLALAFTASCGTLDPGEPSVQLRLDVEAARLGTTPAVAIQVGSRRATLVAAATSGHADGTLQADRFGALPVTVVLRGAAGDSVVGLSFAQDFPRGSSYWIASRVGRSHPVGLCLGTVVSAPIVAGGPDTLFVMYGNLPEGAVC